MRRKKTVKVTARMTRTRTMKKAVERAKTVWTTEGVKAVKRMGAMVQTTKASRPKRGTFGTVPYDWLSKLCGAP